jgi:hypothetical protein
LKNTIQQQKLDKKQRLNMFGGLLKANDDGGDDDDDDDDNTKSNDRNNESKNGSKHKKKKLKKPLSLYSDKKDIQKEENIQNEDDTVIGMINENWLFLMSVILLLLALVLKYTVL